MRTPPPVTDHGRALSILRTFLGEHFEVVDEVDLNLYVEFDYLSGDSSTRVEFEARRGGGVGHAVASTTEYGSRYALVGSRASYGSAELAARGSPEHLPVEGASNAAFVALHRLAYRSPAAVVALSDEVGRPDPRLPRSFVDAPTLALWSVRAPAAEVASVSAALAAIADGAPVGWAARRATFPASA